MSSSVDAPADWVPVERRLLGMDRASLVPAAVVTVLVVIAFWGLPAINSAIEVDDPIHAGDVVQVGTVEFTPAVGWNLARGIRRGDAKRTGRYPGTAVLTAGGLTFEVIVDSYDGTAAELLEQVEQNNTRIRDTAFEVSGSASTIENSTGDRGAMATFTSAGSDGLLGAYVFDGVGVEVVAIGSSSIDDTQHAEDIARMLLSIRPVPEGSAS